MIRRYLDFMCHISEAAKDNIMVEDVIELLNITFSDIDILSEMFSRKHLQSCNSILVLRLVVLFAMILSSWPV